jgi:hypothetical protein
MMSFYLFRLLAETFTVEAEYQCADDLAAMKAAQDLAADVDAVEIWDGKRLVAFIRCPLSANGRISPVAA